MECRVKFLENLKEFYEPGQKLKVDVTLNVPKSEKINKINCVVWGYAKCKWSEEKAPGATSRTDTNRARENFIDETFCLFENPEGGLAELTAGQHKFQVAYILSPHLPTSFKCRNGAIKYKLIVTVDRSWKMNSNFDFPFTVIRPLDLNTEASFLRNPMKEDLSKNFKLDFTSEPLYMSASIPFSGYVPGQTINVDIQVNNQSKTHVKEIKISLKKIVILSSQKPRRKTKELIISERKVVTESVPILTVQHFEKQLLVPSLPPNITNCDIIQVLYELRVKAVTSGLSRSPKLKLPITIGTLPLINPGCRIPPSSSSLDLLPPSYEEVLREAASGDSSDGENSFNPRYPVFDFEQGESSTERQE